MTTVSILYVDDDENALLTARGLRREGGYDVFFYGRAGDAKDAIEGGQRYSIAVIDRSLNHSMIDGDYLMRLSKETNSRSLVISISGYDNKPKWADQHLLKPFTLKSLVRLINDLVR